MQFFEVRNESNKGGKNYGPWNRSSFSPLYITAKYIYVMIVLFFFTLEGERMLIIHEFKRRGDFTTLYNKINLQIINNHDLARHLIGSPTHGSASSIWVKNLMQEFTPMAKYLHLPTLMPFWTIPTSREPKSLVVHLTCSTLLAKGTKGTIGCWYHCWSLWAKWLNFKYL